MNNQEELNTLLSDFKMNEQYFDDVEISKNINNDVSNHMSLYKKTLNKIISMVNVVKILDLGIAVKNSEQYHIVLTNQGIRQRYISDTYTSQSSNLYIGTFTDQIGDAIKAMFNNPELSTLQKNKIRPIRHIDFSFLQKIALKENVDVEKVTSIGTNFNVTCDKLTIPNFTSGYNYMSDFTLLSIKSQVVEQLAEFLKERRATIDLLKSKIKELEAMYPMVFLFGNC